DEPAVTVRRPGRPTIPIRRAHRAPRRPIPRPVALAAAGLGLVAVLTLIGVLAAGGQPPHVAAAPTSGVRVTAAPAPSGEATARPSATPRRSLAAEAPTFDTAMAAVERVIDQGLAAGQVRNDVAVDL